jgi:hypothetical protein
MVGMIDPPTVNARGSLQLIFSMMNRARPVAAPLVEHTMQWTFRIFALFDKFRNLPATRRWTFLQDKVRRLFAGDSNQVRTAPIVAGQPVTNRSGQPSGGVSPARRSEDKRNSKYAHVVWNYLPKPLAVRVIYFSVEYGLGAWGRISSDLEVIKLPGTHGDIDLAAFADQLRSRLQARN